LSTEKRKLEGSSRKKRSVRIGSAFEKKQKFKYSTKTRPVQGRTTETLGKGKGGGKNFLKHVEQAVRWPADRKERATRNNLHIQEKKKRGRKGQKG